MPVTDMEFAVNSKRRSRIDTEPKIHEITLITELTVIWSIQEE